MEEKMIIQGKNRNAKLIRNVIFGIGVVLGLIAAMLYADANEFHYEGYWSYSPSPFPYRELDQYPS